MLVENTSLHLLPNLESLVLSKVNAIHGTVEETEQLKVDTVTADIRDKSLYKGTGNNGFY